MQQWQLLGVSEYYKEMNADMKVFVNCKVVCTYKWWLFNQFKMITRTIPVMLTEESKGGIGLTDEWDGNRGNLGIAPGGQHTSEYGSHRASPPVKPRGCKLTAKCILTAEPPHALIWVWPSISDWVPGLWPTPGVSPGEGNAGGRRDIEGLSLIPPPSPHRPYLSLYHQVSRLFVFWQDFPFPGLVNQVWRRRQMARYTANLRMDSNTIISYRLTWHRQTWEEAPSLSEVRHILSTSPSLTLPIERVCSNLIIMGLGRNSRFHN